MRHDYVPDRLYQRLFQPWTLPYSEWPMAREDWKRVDAICDLPWKGNLLDFGSGDGTLAAMVRSRNPEVSAVMGVEQDVEQVRRSLVLWRKWHFLAVTKFPEWKEAFDGALCCEVLEHMTPEDGAAVLKQIHAALKPDAMLCVTVPYKYGPRADYPGHITLMKEGSWAKMIEECGFTVARWSRDDILDESNDFPVWHMFRATCEK